MIYRKMNLAFSFSFCLMSFCVSAASCQTNDKDQIAWRNLEHAQITLDSLYGCYSYKGSNLLRETYPFDENFLATYLASESSKKPNAYSFLWPYSGTFSALSALIEATHSGEKYTKILHQSVLPGLEEYFDRGRTPDAYSSYITSSPNSDRFYDDNVWIGIDFTDTYLLTDEPGFLNKAKLIWRFIESGMDNQLGGGIYWCEQKKQSKNTCSNAPGAVYALKLFKATKDSLYFYQGKRLYEWTQKHLQDSTDHLYFDNISLRGRIGETKYAYNSGQMLQAAALLYDITKDQSYLTEAQAIAKSSYAYFFDDFESPEGEHFRLLKNGNVWFTAVMFRGYIELYHADRNPVYMNTFQQNLDYAWKNARETNGLFNADWSGKTRDDSKWLLTQAAMVEMYARIAAMNKH